MRTLLGLVFGISICACGDTDDAGSNGDNDKRDKPTQAEEIELSNNSDREAPEGLPPGHYPLRPTVVEFGGDKTKFGTKLVAELIKQPRSYYSLSPFLGYSWMPGNCWATLGDGFEIELSNGSYELSAIEIVTPALVA